MRIPVDQRTGQVEVGQQGARAIRLLFSVEERSVNPRYFDHVATVRGKPQC